MSSKDIVGNISDRLNAFMQVQGLKQKDLVESLNLTSASVSMMCTGKTKPSVSTITLICRIYNVSEQWLRTGEGEMFVPRPRDQQIALFFSSVLKVTDDSSKGDKIKRDLISALAKLSPACWEKLADVAAELTKEE